MKTTSFDLAELRALPFPRATNAEIRILAAPEEKSAEYVARFLPPRLTAEGRAACVGCGLDLTGFLSGTFQWGLAHGSGYCSSCGYPVRMYHFVKDDAGTEHRAVFPLQPHPEELVAVGGPRD